MSLEEDLKARTLALISQQMANWVVEIQRTIAGHQESLVRSLDEIQERVARYDEKINESDIEMAIAEVVASAGPSMGGAAASGPSQTQLKDSLAAIDKGTSLSEVLTYLVNEVSQHVMRCAMFIIKGQNAIGWYARGVESPESVKQITISLNSDTIFRIIHNSRHALRGHSSHSPSTVQALARLGGDPQGILGVPLILRPDKLAAILYCDSDNEEIAPTTADMIETMVLFAGKIIDILAMAPKGVPAPAKTSGGTTPERAAAIARDTDDVRQRASVPPSRPAPPPAPAAQDEGSSTVMFNAASFASLRQQAGGGSKSAVAAPAGPPLSPEEQKQHDDAKRFARLVVSEIKLYNEAKVNEGRRNKDLYERLKEDIERGRQMYSDRIPAGVRDSTNYFYDELVRILAGGDAGALGPM